MRSRCPYDRLAKPILRKGACHGLLIKMYKKNKGDDCYRGLMQLEDTQLHDHSCVFGSRCSRLQSPMAMLPCIRPPQINKSPSELTAPLAYDRGCGAGPDGSSAFHKYGLVVISIHHTSFRNLVPSAPPNTTRYCIDTSSRTCPYPDATQPSQV